MSLDFILFKGVPAARLENSGLAGPSPLTLLAECKRRIKTQHRREYVRPPVHGLKPASQRPPRHRWP